VCFSQFRIDIREFMWKAAIERKPTAWIFTDSQIVDETMLEDINNILNAGEVPNLYAGEEMDKVCNNMVPICKELGIVEVRALLPPAATPPPPPPSSPHPFPPRRRARTVTSRSWTWFARTSTSCSA
jgi:hypothetical protein